MKKRGCRKEWGLPDPVISKPDKAVLPEKKLVLDHFVELILDQHFLVLDVVALKGGVGNDTALDKMLETHKLAKLALKVESVTFLCDQIYIAFALIDNRKEFVDIYITERPYCTHKKSSFQNTLYPGIRK